jgi:hypothetical protein
MQLLYLFLINVIVFFILSQLSGFNIIATILSILLWYNFILIFLTFSRN